MLWDLSGEMLYKYVSICTPQWKTFAKWAILRLLQGSHWLRISSILPKVLCLNNVSMLFMLLDPVGVQANLSLRRVTESLNRDFRDTMWMWGKSIDLNPEHLWTQILVSSLLSVWSWIVSITSLSLNFLCWKTRKMISSSQDGWKD